jgi:hypothetical protein
MTNKTITDLTAASALDGSEILPLTQGGNSRKADLDAIKDYSTQELYAPFDTIGITGDLPSASNASFGTYTFVKPISRTGVGLRYHYKSNGAGTIYVQIVSRSGNTNTIEDERLITVSGAEEGTVDFLDLAYTEGQHVGVRITPSGTLGAVAGTDEEGGWYYTTSQISDGNTYDDATATTSARIVHRFELLEQSVTGDRFVAVEETLAGIAGSDSVPPTFHAHFVLGESHAAGVPTTLSPSEIDTGFGYCYRRATTDLGHLEDPTGNSATAIAGDGRGSMFTSFGAQFLRQTNNAQGALIVNSGEGGTTATTHWATAGSAWLQAVTDWGNAISAAETDELIITGKSISIILGSNDASISTTKSAFKAAIIDLISRARTTVGGGDDVPVILMKTGSYDDGSYATEVAYIQEAQEEIVAEESNVYMGYSAEFAVSRSQMIDNVHMSQTFNEMCGASLALPALAHGSGL